MTEFILGIFLEILLLIGIILLLICPFQKFKKHRKIQIPIGLLFLIIGVSFIDWNAAREAFWNGYHSAR